MSSSPPSPPARRADHHASGSRLAAPPSPEIAPHGWLVRYRAREASLAPISQRSRRSVGGPIGRRLLVSVGLVLLSAVLAGDAAARTAAAPAAATLKPCGSIKGAFSTATDVRVAGMTCAAAAVLLKEGGPVVAPGWNGKSHCTFLYGKTTFVPYCTLDAKTITYRAPLAGGKG